MNVVAFSRRVTLRFLAAASLAVALAGCSSDSEILATVGSEKITVGDFREAAAQSWSQFPFAPDSARVALLERMVQEALLVETAKKSPDTIDSLVRANRERVENQVLTEALVRQLMPQQIPVSDAEVKRLYTLRDSVSHVLVAYVADAAAAAAAMVDLRKGEDFATVSTRYSLPQSVPPGGDAGWVAPGTMIDPLDEAVVSAHVGSTVGPIQIMNQGWFIARVVERRKQDQPPFETAAATLRSTLQQRKQRTVWMRTLDRLRESYKVRTDADGIAALFRHFNPPVPIDSMGRELPPPTAEELATVLGRWDGGPDFRGEFTMAEAFKDLESSSGEAPHPSMLPALEQWVLNRMMERVARLEAKRRGLDQEPANARRIRNLSNQYLASGIVQQEVVGRVQVTEADVRAEYDANSASFAELVSARFEHLTLPDSGSAVRIASRLQGITSLREAVLASSGGMQVQEETVRFPAADPTWGILEGAVKRGADGTIFPPMRTEGGWRIIQLVGKELRTPPFEELSFEIQQMLSQQVAVRMQEARMKALTDSLRGTIPVTMFRERLRRLPWPPKEARMPSGFPMAG